MANGRAGLRTVSITAGVFLAWSTVSVSAWAAPAASDSFDSHSVPQVVTSWFAEKGASSIKAFQDGELAKRVNPDDKAVSASAPLPVYTIVVPGYDLDTQTVTGSTSPADVLSQTDEYCARVLLDGRPAAAKHCVELQADDSVEVSGGGQEDFTDALPWKDVHALVEIRDSLFALSTDHRSLTALNSAADYDIGTGATVPVREVIAAVARYKAEYDLVSEVSEPMAGAAPSILGTDAEEAAEWQAEVAQALTIRNASPNPSPTTVTVGAAAQTSGTSTGPVVGWVVGTVVLLGSIAWLGITRHRASADRGSAAASSDG